MCLPSREKVAYESAPPKHHPRTARRHYYDDDDEPRVSFQQDSNQVHFVSTSCSHAKTSAERHELWYNRDDIKEFRRQAANLGKRMREDPQSCAKEETRGLELRTSLHRQDRKQMIVKRILKAQEDDSTPEDLARIAQQHSIWSRKLALAQAHKDYYAAYHPNLTSVLPEMPALLDCGRDLSRNKRSLLGTSLEQSGRRVRCRMF
ncbi:expressed unknown protein [Seminavis robusta]|uniref:Uncharacterized protein n=1 Tax=Seminavis robusta TaxID=568900 RepID=A0A9N8DN73_9STRA|nr:expressed unknown protein [Seminavis robusta]|eukprot:Sro254_g100110.1 n/a (205) ;mRNA; r:18584-19198